MIESLCKLEPSSDTVTMIKLFVRGYDASLTETNQQMSSVIVVADRRQKEAVRRGYLTRFVVDVCGASFTSPIPPSA